MNPRYFKSLLTSAEYFDIPFDTAVREESTFKLGEDSEIEIPIRLPQLSNSANKIASLGEICRYLAKVAEKKVVEIYTGFAVDRLLYDKTTNCWSKTKGYRFK